MSYEEQHRAEWETAATHLAEAVKGYTDHIFHEYAFVRTYEREGVATALDTAARRVTVTLLAVQRATGATVQASYGQPSYTASQIVGKAVRVWERVESRLSDHGPLVVSRTYIVDTVLGG